MQVNLVNRVVAFGVVLLAVFVVVMLALALVGLALLALPLFVGLVLYWRWKIRRLVRQATDQAPVRSRQSQREVIDGEFKVKP